MGGVGGGVRNMNSIWPPWPSQLPLGSLLHQQLVMLWIEQDMQPSPVYIDFTIDLCYAPLSGVSSAADCM